MDAYQHHAPVRVLPHVKKLDDALGDFIVRVTCPCGASRHIEPEALARITGRSVTFAALATRMRCSQCGTKVAEVAAVARPRPRGNRSQSSRRRNPRKWPGICCFDSELQRPRF
jgi:hypothetical protein